MLEDNASKSREFIGISLDDPLENIPEECESLTFTANNMRVFPTPTVVLANLKILKINQNLLVEVPTVLYSLINLQKLDLSNNNITRISPGISTLSNLEILNLSFNNINAIPNEIGEMRKLRFLYLRKNCLKRLPKEIETLKDIKVLDLRDNMMLSNNLDDSLGHLYLKTIFGENLILVEEDFYKLNKISRTKMLLKEFVIRRLGIGILVVILFLVFIWIRKLRKEENSK